MNNFTFLTKEQIFGKKRLEIFKKYERASAITDFSILLGGYVSNYYTNEGNDGKNHTGYWWTKTCLGDQFVPVVTEEGNKDYDNPCKRIACARPVLDFTLISNDALNKKRNKDGILEIEYGEYPQYIVPEILAKKLEKGYLTRTLTLTGKRYTTDLDRHTKSAEIFEARIHKEYEYCGKKYVRVLGELYSSSEILSDGTMIEEGTPYWISVEPIKWIIDEKTNIAISKKLLFSGLQFYKKDYIDVIFEDTNIYKFMNKYFSKEIIIENKIKNENRKSVQVINPYNLNYSQVSEEEIIKGAIESNISVFLHGRSSEGKSARVKQIDPNCVIIYLRNATPESLNGKSVYNSETGEMIDIKPTWLKKLEIVCEKEPDKNHIVFFDEITNALPSIQGIAFNIVLDKEVNGMWKLPDNARIVAAGNEMNDSLAANQLAEPLFNRFAHVYIETTVDKWLEWASKNNIHPAIYAYIAYRKDEALRSKYNGEKPNADPRKWEMASNILYKTRRPEMLRALLGTDITNEFIWFTKQKVITLEDILNDNYSEEDLNLNTGEKYMTVVGLLNVKEEDYPKVLEFLKKLGSEFISIFNSLWTKDNEERLEIIAESKQDIKKKIRKIQNTNMEE